MSQFSRNFPAIFAEFSRNFPAIFRNWFRPPPPHPRPQSPPPPWLMRVQQAAVSKLVHWLFCYAKWQGTDYTDMTIPAELQPKGCRPSWCADIHLLRVRSAMP